MKRGPKIIYLRRKVLAAVGCAAAADMELMMDIGLSLMYALFPVLQSCS